MVPKLERGTQGIGMCKMVRDHWSNDAMVSMDCRGLVLTFQIVRSTLHTDKSPSHTNEKLNWQELFPGELERGRQWIGMCCQ